MAGVDKVKQGSLLKAIQAVNGCTRDFRDLVSAGQAVYHAGCLSSLRWPRHICWSLIPGHPYTVMSHCHEFESGDSDQQGL